MNHSIPGIRPLSFSAVGTATTAARDLRDRLLARFRNWRDLQRDLSEIAAMQPMDRSELRRELLARGGCDRLEDPSVVARKNSGSLQRDDDRTASPARSANATAVLWSVSR